MELEMRSDDQVTFTFLTQSQRIISSFFRILNESQDLEKLLGEKLVSEIQHNIDPKNGSGSITGSPVKMNLLLRLFATTSEDVSFVLDGAELEQGNEDYQFFSLFTGLSEIISGNSEIEISYCDMISDDQKQEIQEAFASYDAQLPFIFRLEEDFQVFPQTS